MSFPVHTVVERRDEYFHKPYTGDLSGAQYFVRKQIEHLYHRPILHHSGYIYISLGHPKQPLSQPLGTVFTWGKVMFQKPFDGIERRLAQVQHIANDIVQTLAGLGIELRLLSEDELWEHQLRHFNLET